jgi:amino acid transporter
MPSSREAGLGTFSTVSIGIGGMVGGGIFAVTGLTVEVTKGAAPIAFLIAGIVALLTSYSYLKLTLRFPGEGGTVEFLNRAFGGGIVTGAANILLLLSYVVRLRHLWRQLFPRAGTRLLASCPDQRRDRRSGRRQRLRGQAGDAL